MLQMLDATTVISLAALIVSVAFGLITWRTARRQNTLQQRVADIEAARERDRIREAQSARVTAEILRDGRSYRLVVLNSGRATARNLRVLLNGQPPLGHPLVPRGEEEVTTLGPDAAASYTLLVMLGTPRVLHAQITWQDDSGAPGRWESQLKF